MRGEPRFFDVDERLKELSAKGDDLERLNAIVDFEIFRADLEGAMPGRPAPYDQVLMFRVLILQSSHSLSDERTEYLIKDRLSFMRFLGLSLAQSVPDANSIWNFREALTRAKIDGKPAIEVLFKRFDGALTKAGFLAMGGQIIDATIVTAPKRRNTEAKRRTSKKGAFPRIGRASPPNWPEGSRCALDGQIFKSQAVRRRREARRSGDPRLRLQEPYRHRPRPRPDPDMGSDGRLPPRRRPIADLVDKTNTAGDVWADTAYRSAKNEKHLADNGLPSQILRKKPQGKPMPEAVARANGKKSKVRAYVEHVFA
jgi:transposase, IS5 family